VVVLSNGDIMQKRKKKCDFIFLLMRDSNGLGMGRRNRKIPCESYSG
jgi:hypothetical protein